MKRLERYQNALKIAEECGNVFFEVSIKAELKHMQDNPELAAEEATPNVHDDYTKD